MLPLVPSSAKNIQNETPHNNEKEKYDKEASNYGALEVFKFKQFQFPKTFIITISLGSCTSEIS
jgi:hypothetical protein